MSERVDHPPHYGGAVNPYEAIKVIEAWGLGFCLGNAVKYISSAGKKDPSTDLEDLKKARWYLDREIQGRSGGTVDAALPVGTRGSRVDLSGQCWDGRALQRLRAAKGLRQADLASRLGVTRNWISLVENGASPSRRLLAAILTALDVPVPVELPDRRSNLVAEVAVVETVVESTKGGPR